MSCTDRAGSGNGARSSATWPRPANSCTGFRPQSGQNYVEATAFGVIITQTSAAAQGRFGFTSKDYDSQTGFQFNIDRYYAPALGIFISMDPIQFDGGLTTLYGYCGNDPTNATDPSGLDIRHEVYDPDKKDRFKQVYNIAIHSTQRAGGADTPWWMDNDNGWKLTPVVDKNYWDVKGSAGAKTVLEGEKDHSINTLFLDAHCGTSLTADLLTDPEYRKLIKAKVVPHGVIRIYSCTMGTTEKGREELQNVAEDTGCTVWACTGTVKTPWGGGDGEWLRYEPGQEVPRKGKGDRRPEKEK
jgi:RHS repeat-associated protein